MFRCRSNVPLPLPFPGAFGWPRGKYSLFLFCFFLGGEAAAVGRWGGGALLRWMTEPLRSLFHPGIEHIWLLFPTDTVKNDLRGVFVDRQSSCLAQAGLRRSPITSSGEKLYKQNLLWFVETRHQCLQQLLCCHSDWWSLVWTQMMHINHVFNRKKFLFSVWTCQSFYTRCWSNSQQYIKIIWLI